MEKKIREFQLKILNVFPRITRTFALTGGTALELFYLNHRFSRDLDFFSYNYSMKEIDTIIGSLKKILRIKLQLESEFIADSRAKVRFYTIPIKGISVPLKIDFVEDVLFNNPKIRYHDKIPVYDIENIYFQKITAITGTRTSLNTIGKEITTGRNETRDIIDLYFLSKKIKLLHIYLDSLSREYQRGIVQWYQTYSRQDFIIDFLDYSLYDKKINSKQIIKHIDDEIKIFLKREIG